MQVEKIYSHVNPFISDTPSTLLERVVQITDKIWSSTFAPQAIDVYREIILNSPIHASILGNFSLAMYRYLRCDFRITIRVNSTPYHQGSLIVAWQPSNYINTAFPGSIVTAIASMPNMISLSASQQDQCTIDMPFCCTLPHLDLSFAAMPGVTSTRPMVHMAALNPLRSSSPSVTDTVPISIWVSMFNIETYGILDPTSITQNAPISAVRQSAKTRANTEAQSKDKLGETAKGIITFAKPILHSIPIVSDIINFGKSIFANLDKPSTDQATTFVTTRSHRGHTHLTGVDYSESLSSFPNYSVSKDIGFPTSSDMKVTDYASIPALYYTTSVTTKGVVLTTPIHPMTYTSSVRTEVDYLAFATGFFRYYRGSIKFLFQFVGTPFYSCRFKLSVVYSAGPPPGGTGNGTGFYSRIVDVKGDAWTSIVVPYLSNRLWCNTAKTSIIESVPYLILETLTDVQGSSLPADAVYYVNVWRAAGPDYQLSSQCHYTGDMTPIPAVRQSCLKNKWDEPSEAIKTKSSGFTESGLFMADQSTTMTDMCKRFTPHSSSSSFRSYPGEVASTVTPYNPLDLLSTTFLYWRGSRRMKFANSVGFARLSNLSIAVNVDGDPLVLDNSPDVYIVAVPWYCTELARPTLQAGSGYVFTNPSNAPMDVDISSWTGQQMAAGDDFAYYWIVPPNPRRMVAPSPSTTTFDQTNEVVIHTKPLNQAQLISRSDKSSNSSQRHEIIW